MLCVEMQV